MQPKALFLAWFFWQVSQQILRGLLVQPIICLTTTNANLVTTNANLTAGDAATLADSKAYTDAKALTVGADTLASANNYTNAKSAETLKSANAYTDTRAAETLKSANAFTSEQVTKLETKTAGGVAAIAAMASVPQLTAGKNLSVGPLLALELLGSFNDFKNLKRY